MLSCARSALYAVQLSTGAHFPTLGVTYGRLHLRQLLSYISFRVLLWGICWQAGLAGCKPPVPVPLFMPAAANPVDVWSAQQLYS